MSKPHNVVAAVNVYRLSRDAAAAVAGQKDRRRGYFVDIDVALQGGLFGLGLHHFAQAADATRSQGLHRSGGDGVDANVVLAEIVGEVADAGFQRGLGHSHHVVLGDNFLGAVVGQGDNAAAAGHERGRGAGERNQRVGAGIEGNAEGFTAGLGEVVLQRLGGSVGDAVDEGVELAVFRFQLGEERGDLVVVGDVALEAGGVGQGGDHVVGFLLEALVLIGYGQGRA